MKLSTIITLALAGTAVTLLFTTQKGQAYRSTAIDSAKKWGRKLRSRVEETAEDTPALVAVMRRNG